MCICSNLSGHYPFLLPPYSKSLLIMLPILDMGSMTAMTTPKSTPVRRPPPAHDDQHNSARHGGGGGFCTRLARFLSQRRVADAPQGPPSDDLPPGYGYDLSYNGDAWGYNDATLSQESLPPYFPMDRFVAHEPTELIISKHRLGTHIVIQVRFFPLLHSTSDLDPRMVRS